MTALSPKNQPNSHIPFFNASISSFQSISFMFSTFKLSTFKYSSFVPSNQPSSHLLLFNLLGFQCISFNFSTTTKTIKCPILYTWIKMKDKVGVKIQLTSTYCLHSLHIWNIKQIYSGQEQNVINLFHLSFTPSST